MVVDQFHLVKVEQFHLVKVDQVHLMGVEGGSQCNFNFQALVEAVEDHVLVVQDAVVALVVEDVLVRGNGGGGCVGGALAGGGCVAGALVGGGGGFNIIHNLNSIIT
ncbi:unnamed protein product [Calypogeia fissa]